MNIKDINKKITLQLVEIDGNAFSLMGAFTQQARKEKWLKEEIDAVMAECMSGDYNHLLSTLMDFCQDSDENEDENEYDDYPYDKYK